MNTHPIFGHSINGMLDAQRPSGCPSCAAAEAQCDRMAQRIRELEAALALEVKARVACAEMAHEAKLALARQKGREGVDPQNPPPSPLKGKTFTRTSDPRPGREGCPNCDAIQSEGAEGTCLVCGAVWEWR